MPQNAPLLLPNAQLDFQEVFNSTPGNFIILGIDAPHYTILAVSDDLLGVCHKERKELVGKGLFEAYREYPEAVTATAAAQLGASLHRTLLSKKPDQMPVVRFDLPRATEAWEERYWSVTNKPVVDAEAAVGYIIQAIVEVTAQVKAGEKEIAARNTEVPAQGKRKADTPSLPELQGSGQGPDPTGSMISGMEPAAAASALILARQQLIESEYSFRNIVQQAPVAILLLHSRKLLIEAVNKPMLRFMNNNEAILGKPLLEALPELATHPLLPSLLGIFDTGEAFTAYEVPSIRPAADHAKKRYYNISFTPIFENGGLTKVLQIATDVTEQVKARNELEENQDDLKRFKFMADQAKDAFILMREDGTFAYLNKKALEAWGYTEAEARHIRVPDVDPIYQEELFAQAFARAQKETIPKFETLHKRKDGHIYPVEVNMGGLMLGHDPYMFAVARNITERKQSEEALAAKNEELIRINNDLDNFVYTASHDLKAPISNIEGLIQMLSGEIAAGSVPEGEVQHMLGLMLHSAQRFKKTITSLTDVIKLQHDRQQEFTAVNLPEVVQGVMLDLEQLIQPAAAQIAVEVYPDCFISFSEKYLRSIVFNLISNAVKYRSPDRPSQVRVACHTEPEHTVLVVQDNGSGLKKKHQDQLFGMFKRFHDHVEGTGIGLYMVKRMVENAGGRIEVESQEGEGTTFRVYFRRM
jgi:PAS domain S-box-containing protein